MGPVEIAETVGPEIVTRSEPDAPMPRTVGEVLDSGVLIVISKPSQQMHVFRDGELWNSSPVSTGKPGHATPVGMFPILQKRVFHRSNIYSNAPMPHMQRLTWDGIAIHAGYVPGHPASHGCIRVPAGFARTLYRITGFDRTTVVVSDYPARSEESALAIAMNMPSPRAGPGGVLVQRPEPLLPTPSADPDALAEREPSPPKTLSGQTIQLAAATTSAGAEAQWGKIISRHPELSELAHAVIPAMVDAQQVYRLRASGAGAHQACRALKARGTACFAVS